MRWAIAAYLPHAAIAAAPAASRRQSAADCRATGTTSTTAPTAGTEEGPCRPISPTLARVTSPNVPAADLTTARRGRPRLRHRPLPGDPEAERQPVLLAVQHLPRARDDLRRGEGADRRADGEGAPLLAARRTGYTPRSTRSTSSSRAGARARRGRTARGSGSRSPTRSGDRPTTSSCSRSSTRWRRTTAPGCGRSTSRRRPSRPARRSTVGSRTRPRARSPTCCPQGVVDAMTRLVLVNAIYFNAAWKAPFRRSVTKPLPFHLIDGKLGRRADDVRHPITSRTPRDRAIRRWGCRTTGTSLTSSSSCRTRARSRSSSKA